MSRVYETISYFVREHGKGGGGMKICKSMQKQDTFSRCCLWSFISFELSRVVSIAVPSIYCLCCIIAGLLVYGGVAFKMVRREFEF